MESMFQYQLEQPVNDEDYEDEDEDDEGFGGGAKKVEEVEEDPLEGQLLKERKKQLIILKMFSFMIQGQIMVKLEFSCIFSYPQGTK